MSKEADLWDLLCDFHKAFQNNDDYFTNHNRGRFEYTSNKYCRVGKYDGIYSVFCGSEGASKLRRLIMQYAKKNKLRYLENKQIYDDISQKSFIGLDILKDRVNIHVG